MLRRAASSAYSWWWASHVRTKQSKWLESSLLDMEGNVQSVLEVIMHADNSTIKEETECKAKPELITFIQEFYKAYRELADRYDYISGELQKANNAMARICPEQAHFGMEDDDDGSGSSSPTDDDKPSPRKSRPQDPSTLSSQLTIRKNSVSLLKEKKTGKQVLCSQIISKDKAQEEIDKLQKGILVLQTEKEFIQSSFESGMTKYWGIEKLITQMQEKVNSLVDKFNASVVIEDHEAQALMTITALRSCETNLLSLHEQQKRCMKESRIESQNIKNIVEKLRVIKGQHEQSEPKSNLSSIDEDTVLPSAKELDEGICNFNQKTLKLQPLYEKIRENFKNDRSIFMLAEEINHLAEKVIRMETRLSSQVAQIHRLRVDIVEIQRHLQILEKEEKILIDDLNGFCHNLELVEVALHRVQELDKRVQDENDQIRAHFIEACYSFNDLSKRLRFPEQKNLVGILGSNDDSAVQRHDHEIQLGKPDHQTLPEEGTSNGLTDESSLFSSEPNCNSVESETSVTQEIIEQENKSASSLHSHEHSDANGILQKGIYSSDDSISADEQKSRGGVAAESSSKDQDIHAMNQEKGQNDETKDFSLSKLQQLLQSGLEDREKILLTEYTSILRNYKETKRKLEEAEKKHQDLLSKATAEVQDLKNVIVIKDQEIRSLQQNLHFLESCWNENSDFQAPETEGSKHCSSLSFATERQGSWFSIAFNVPENMDAETDGKPLCVLDEDTSLQHEKRFRDKAKKEPPFEGPLIQVDNEHKGKNANVIPRLEDAMEHQYQERYAMTAVEEKFRRDIDKLLEETVHFWSRCTSSFELRNNYQLKVEDIQKNIIKLNEENTQEGSSSTKELSEEPDSTSIYKQLSDLQEQFSEWIKENCLLKEELRNRFSSLYNMGGELSRASSKEPSKGEEIQVRAYYKAIFQGELLRMQEENNKVSEELQEGLNCVKSLQDEVVKALGKLGESPKQSALKVTKTHHAKSFAKRLPLRSFLFGSKTKKPALFPCMNLALQKQYSDIAAEIPPPK